MATIQSLQAELDELKLELADSKKPVPPAPVVLKKDQKLRLFYGDPADFAAWKEEAEDAVTNGNLSGRSAADLVYEKLRADARSEIKCRGSGVRESHVLILSALEEVFGERKSASQHLSTFLPGSSGKARVLWNSRTHWLIW